MLLTALRSFRRSIDGKRHVQVGWLLRTDHAGFIWPSPKPAAQSASRSKHAKSVSRCPAVVDHEARLFQIQCPFDLRLRMDMDKEQPQLVDVDGRNSSVLGRSLAQMTQVFPRDLWRHPDRPLLQFNTPYTFVADEEVYLMQLPPLLHYSSPRWPGVVIGGRVPIHIWPRPLAWAFEWHDVQQELVLRRGDPWFYCRVVNYVNGTFGLFDIARQRRPERLLVREER
jgi:hypothetical protein